MQDTSSFLILFFCVFYKKPHSLISLTAVQALHNSVIRQNLQLESCLFSYFSVLNIPLLSHF